MRPLDESQVASAAQFDRQSANYGRSHILADTTDVAHALEAIPRVAHAEALDVATGGGHNALCLARAGYEVTLGDISEKMLAAAGALLRGEGFEVGRALFPAEDIPFDDEAFDLVACRVAAHHFSSPARFVSEAARVLRPGGSLLLIDCSVPDEAPEVAEWLHRVEKWRDPSHGQFLSRRRWESLVAEVGLSLRLSELHPRKQPDLDWYFQTANTPPANRENVLQAIETAPESVWELLRLRRENGKWVWWWPMLTLVAGKAG